MKKRILSAILCAVLILSSVGCASKEADTLVETVQPPSTHTSDKNTSESGGGDKNNSGYSTSPELSPGRDDVLLDAEEGVLDSPSGPSEAPMTGVTPTDPEQSGKYEENPFVSVSEANVSTFSADVDTASYAYFRKLVNYGYSLSELTSTMGKTLRTEELVNYFDYSCPAPSDGKLFGVNFNAAPCPWNSESVLLTATLATEPTVTKSANNLVFLIDVSGSMLSADKLELLKKSFSYLISSLGDDDIISIVTYSGDSGVVLDGCSGAKKDIIMNAVNSLTAGGRTNGEAGMKTAYEIAESHFLPDGNNRIIMASDGDLNVGISTSEEIEKFVSEKRGAGVYLSVLGFGTGNYKDSVMETIADKGNGVYYYIDGEYEAEKIFGEDLLSTLYPVASDVKLQLTFDKEAVKSYRLIGYENRMLNEEDFEDDTKDAGELGAGHCVTVCYELILKESTHLENAEWAKLAVRYKPLNSEKSVLEEYELTKSIYTTSPDSEFKFISAVIEASSVIRQSDYTDTNIADIISDLSSMNLTGDKAQFKELLEKLISNN